MRSPARSWARTASRATATPPTRSAPTPWRSCAKSTACPSTWPRRCRRSNLAIQSGKQIPIEERSSDEVTFIGGQRFAPEGVKARHPAFDVTPARLIAGIVTQNGIARAPYEESIPKLFK
ncbi:MAG: hypothetical protein QM765_53270 [Myxococcales bacterium]